MELVDAPDMVDAAERRKLADQLLRRFLGTLPVQRDSVDEDNDKRGVVTSRQFRAARVIKFSVTSILATYRMHRSV